MARGVGGIGPANIMKHLKGVHFPVSKNGLVELAEGKKGSEFPDTDQVIAVIKKLPDQEYQSVAEIMKAIGKIE